MALMDAALALGIPFRAPAHGISEESAQVHIDRVAPFARAPDATEYHLDEGAP
jgi:hypothetical protein